MMDKILNAKHWQIFLFLIAIPFAITMGVYFYSALDILKELENSINNKQDPDSEVLLNYAKTIINNVLPTVALSVVCLAIWHWALGVKLQEYLVPELRRKNIFFKFSILFPPIYMVIMIFFMINILSTVFTPEFMNNPPKEVPSFVFGIFAILPLHFLAVFCQFYALYYIGKMLKMAELKRDVTLSEFIGEALLVMLFPVGVWLIQPKVNALLGENHEEDYIMTD